MDHLILHCLIACVPWNLVFCLVGITWVILRMVIEYLACWIGQLGGKRELKLGKLSVFDVVYLERKEWVHI